MADEPQPQEVDKSDSVRHGDAAAVDAAKQKMQAAISGDGQPAADDKKSGDDLKVLERVRVYSPYKTYYDGPASSISAENDTGPFDILPGHKNFMTLIKAGEIVVRNSRGGEEHIKTNTAIMHVSTNIVRVFLDV